MLGLFHHPQLDRAPRTPPPREGIQQAAPDLVSAQSRERGSSAGSTVNTAPSSSPPLVHGGDARGGEGRPQGGQSPGECSICGGRRFLAIDSGCQEEGNGTPLQYSCLENPMDRRAWWAAVHGVTKSRTQLSDFTFTFHFHALEKEMATHSSVLAWRIPGTGKPGGLPSMGSHRFGHD